MGEKFPGLVGGDWVDHPGLAEWYVAQYLRAGKGTHTVLAAYKYN